MKFYTLMALLAVVVALLAAPASAADHPRLFMDAKELPALRAKVQKEPYATMVARIKQDLDAGNWGSGPMGGGYDAQVSAHRHAFMYLLTGQASYAKRSQELVEQVIAQPSWANGRTKGLTLYVAGLYVAICYDHCYPAWDEAFRKKVSAAIKKNADVVRTNGGTEQNRNAASNWQGLRFSTAGLMYLACDEGVDAKEIDACYNGTKRYLQANLGTDKNSRGWNIEGLGYTYYPMANGVAPFAVAMARKDPAKDLRREVPALAWTLWTCYAASVKTPMGLLRPDFGDDNPGTNGEGSFGFAFYFAPPEIKPGLRYWYDRTVGASGNKTFDNARFGTAASILFYPADVAEKDPMTIPAWREALMDTKGNGYITFRNQYKDETDVVAQMYLKLRGQAGHAGPDALSFRIAGLGTLWGTGGGRYGPKHNGMDAYLRSMNTLYAVDPDGSFKTSSEPGKLVGEPVLSADGGGHVVATIGTNNVGVSKHTRRMWSSFDKSTGAHAAFVFADTSADGKFWQMVTLAPNQITVGKGSFTITSPEGHTLKATVCYPAGNPPINAGTRPRGSNAADIKDNNFVHVQGEGTYVIAMTLAAKGQAHPAVNGTFAAGEGISGSVTIGKATVTIAGDTIK